MWISIFIALLMATIVFLLYKYVFVPKVESAKKRFFSLENETRTLKEEVKKIEQLNKKLIQNNEEIASLKKYQQTLAKSILASLPKKEKNDIEKKDENEIPMTEDIRIPITNGLKVQFEGDKMSYPINIE